MIMLPKVSNLRARAAFAALALAVPIGVAFPTTAAVAQADPLDNVVRALRSSTTMKADFVQTDRSGQSVRGELTLKNPGRIRFEYGRGGNVEVVTSGRALTLQV